MAYRLPSPERASARGEVVSVRIKAAHKHHYALKAAFSAEVPDALPQEFILKWYRGDYPYGSGDIPHALVWESESYLESAMRAFQDWACDKLPV